MLEEKCLSFIQDGRMMESGDAVIVAVSGGPDSTALLHILKNLSDRLKISLTACHINHNLRGEESNSDEKFVEKLCKELSVPLKTFSINVEEEKNLHGGSTQSVAHEMRYKVFEEVLSEGFGNKVALAHTADDNAESVLMNFIRGSGVKGLRGIEAVRGKFIRPLIKLRKLEIVDYLDRNKILYRVDSSNASPKYLRNKIRHELLPTLKIYNPLIVENLERSSRIFGDIEEYLGKQAQENFIKCSTPNNAGDIILSRNSFGKLHTALQREVLIVAIDKLRGSSRDVSYENIESLRTHIKKGTSGEIDLPNLKVILSGDSFIFQSNTVSAIPDYSYLFKKGESLTIKEVDAKVTSKIIDKKNISYSKNCETVYIDSESLPTGTLIRNRRDGDRFHPLGSKGSGKLKKFFIDAKVPKWERGKIPLLTFKNEVYWIAGFRLSEKVKVREESKVILKISIDGL